MAYKLNKITIRTNNSKEGIKNIGDVWKDFYASPTYKSYIERLLEL